MNPHASYMYADAGNQDRTAQNTTAPTITIPEDVMVDTDKKAQLKSAGRYMALGAAIAAVTAVFMGKGIVKFALFGGGGGLLLGWMLGKDKKAPESPEEKELSDIADIMISSSKKITQDGKDLLLKEYDRLGAMLEEKVKAANASTKLDDATKLIISKLKAIEAKLKTSGFTLE